MTTKQQENETLVQAFAMGFVIVLFWPILVWRWIEDVMKGKR